jgi:hypothetical protein
MNIKLNIQNKRETHLVEIKKALTNKEKTITKFENTVDDFDIDTFPFQIEKHPKSLLPRAMNYDEACSFFWVYIIQIKDINIKMCIRDIIQNKFKEVKAKGIISINKQGFEYEFLYKNISYGIRICFKKSYPNGYIKFYQREKHLK